MGTIIGPFWAGLVSADGGKISASCPELFLEITMSVSVLQLPPLPKSNPSKNNWCWMLRILAVVIFLGSNLWISSESSFLSERIALRQASNRKEQDAWSKQQAVWKQERAAWDEKYKLVSQQTNLLSEGKTEEADRLRLEIEKQENLRQKKHLEYEALGDQISFIRADYGNALDLLLAHRGLRLANANLITFLVAIGLWAASFIPWFFSRKSSLETPAA